MSYINIALSGGIGTGTTTLAEGLAEKLGWRYQGAGQFFRKWHEEHGIPLNDTYRVPEEVDKKVDFGFQDQMKTEGRVVFESHLAGWLAKDLDRTVKILTVCGFDLAVKRLSEREGVEFNQALADYRVRTEALAKKFKKLYGVENCYDARFFDLVIDTSVSKGEVLEQVLAGLGKAH